MFQTLAPSRALFSRYVAPLRRQLLVLSLLLFGNIGLQLLGPQLLRYFIDRSQAGGPVRALLAAGALYMVVALLQRAVALGATFVSTNVGWHATNNLRAELALRCLRLDMGFHKRHAPGELVERIDGDVSALANLFSQGSIQVLGNGLLMLAILLLLFREDWRVGAGLTGYALLTLLLLQAVHPYAVRRWNREREAESEQMSFLEERLSGAEDIRANGAVPYVLRRFGVLADTLLASARAAFLMRTLTGSLARLTFVAGYTVGVGLGVFLFLRGQVTIGTVYLIIAYIGLLSTPLEELRRQVDDLQQAAASVGRVQALLELSNAAPPPSPAPEQGRAQAAEVVFEGVSFAYEQEQVLQEISFRLQPGRVLGVLGRTGSGKTTLTRLLLRLYEPSSGEILLDGVPLGSLPLPEVRARVGMVTQEVQLFAASVRDNLTFFDPTPQDPLILQVLDFLGLTPWLATLPHGLSSVLAGGHTLSAGEAQLLAFARVFLRNPDVVVLDEASSRLDPATEQQVERAIDQLLRPADRQRTAIIIAHRLATVQRADDIMILEAGRIVEAGPRLALAADPTSRFYSLLQDGLEEVLS